MPDLTVTAADHAAVAAATTGPVATPWYKSTSVLGIVATVALLVAQKLGYLTEVTNDQAVQFVILVLPQLVALYGRLTTTKPIVTATATKADALNSIAA